VIRGVTQVEAFEVRSRAVRLEGFIEDSFDLHVEAVANEGHRVAIHIACIQQLRHFDRPVGYGPSDAGRRLSEAHERFGKQENAGRVVAFVLVIDPPAMLHRRSDRHPRLLEQQERLFVPAHHAKESGTL